MGMGKGMTKLPLKVIPGSSKDVVAGWLEDALKVRVRAPAERGKANKSVEALVASALGLPPASVRIVSGQTSPRKIAEISDLSLDEVYRRLAKPQVSG